jgi:competence protein ComFB
MGRMNMKYENIMETLLEEKLDEILPTLDCCTCEKCRADIISYALNRLSPKYVNSEQGRVLAKLDTLHNQFEVDMLSALCEAAQMVKKHPRH